MTVTQSQGAAPTDEAASEARMQDLWNRIKVLVAVWLFVTPWILGYFSGAGPAGESIGWALSWNSWIAAMLVAFTVIAAADVGAASADEMGCQIWLQWMHIALGAWLIVTPWTLGAITLSADVFIDYWVVGVVFFLLSIYQLASLYRLHRVAIEPQAEGSHAQGRLAFAGRKPTARP